MKMENEIKPSSSRNLVERSIAGALSALQIEASVPGKHVNAVGMLTELAELFNVDVSPEDQSYWRAAVSFSFAVDEYVDADTGAANEQGFQDTVRSLVEGKPVGGISEESVQEFSEVFKSLDADKQSAFVDCDLLAFSKRQANSTSPEAYLLSNSTEANVFADIISLPIKEGSDADAREAFNNWLHLFSQAAYSQDNLRDNKKDFQSGRSPLEPGIRTNIALARAASADMMRWMSQTPFKAYLIIIRKIIGNRLPDSLKP